MDESVLGNVVGSLIDRNKDEHWGGGFIWVILLLFLFGGGYGFRNNGNMATTQDVATATAYNQVDNGIRSLERGQSNFGYNVLDQFGRTNLAMQGGMANLQQAIAESAFASKDCCCTTNRNVDSVKYELSKGIDANRFELTRNVDALRYDTAQQTCAITSTDTANTQKILDAICALKSEAKDAEIARLRTDLQAAQLTLAQGVQTQTIVGALKAPAPVPAYVVANPFCNCNNGYAYNGGTVIA